MELHELQQRIRDFRDARDWKQFHSPKNLAASVAIEAAELLEIFQWCDSADSVAVAEQRRDRVLDEVADVAIYLLELADILGIDVSAAVLAKLERNEHRYPADRARGRSEKWDEL
jgi:dCTP diphosphatase